MKFKTFWRQISVLFWRQISRVSHKKSLSGGGSTGQNYYIPSSERLPNFMSNNPPKPNPVTPTEELLRWCEGDDGKVYCTECEKKAYSLKHAVQNVTNGRAIALKACSVCDSVLLCPACQRAHFAGHADDDDVAAMEVDDEEESASSGQLNEDVEHALGAAALPLPAAALPPPPPSGPPPSAAALARQAPPSGPVRCCRCHAHHKGCVTSDEAAGAACDNCRRAGVECDRDPAHRRKRVIVGVAVAAPKPKQDRKDKKKQHHSKKKHSKKHRDRSPTRSSAGAKKTKKKVSTPSSSSGADWPLLHKPSSAGAAAAGDHSWTLQTLRKLHEVSDNEHGELTKRSRECKEHWDDDGCDECTLLTEGYCEVKRVAFDCDRGMFTVKARYAGKSAMMTLHKQHSARLCDFSDEFLRPKVVSVVEWLTENNELEPTDLPMFKDVAELLRKNSHYAIKDICAALGAANDAESAKEELVGPLRGQIYHGDGVVVSDLW